MKQVIRNIIRLATFLLWLATPLAGQDSGYLDVLDLNNGSRLTGTITGMQGDSVYTFRLVTGATLQIHSRIIRRMYQKAQFRPQILKPYNFKDTGWYRLIQMDILDGQPASNVANWRPGFGINLQSGYRFNRWIGLGGGIRYSQFAINSVEKVISGYAEVRGYVLEKPFSPYYALATGYGWAYTRGANILDASGGFYWAPQIGVRLGAFRQAVATMGIGYQFQRASFLYNISQWDRRTLEKNIGYRRLTFSTGILF